MEVISINERSDKKRRQDLLEILDYLRAEIENGNIDEIVAATIDRDGDCQIHACVKDLPGGVGLFEIGKHILISQEA